MWGEYYKNRLDFFLIYLESRFHAVIAKAQDKEYAREYMRDILFRGNLHLLYDTIFFSSLYNGFEHHQKMGEADYLQLTVDIIPALRKQAQEAREMGFICYIEGHQNNLDPHYKAVVNAQIFSLDQILQHEKNAIDRTDEEVIEMLAYYQAINILSITLDPEKNEVVETKFHKKARERAEAKFKTWTRPQQTLYFKFVLESTGITYENTPKMTYIRLFLPLLRLDDKAPGGTDIYKIIWRGLNYAAKKTVDRDLKLILSFFDGVPDKKIPELIQAAIVKVGYVPKPKSTK